MTPRLYHPARRGPSLLAEAVLFVKRTKNSLFRTRLAPRRNYRSFLLLFSKKETFFVLQPLVGSRP
jgi:hypothetical protein